MKPARQAALLLLLVVTMVFALGMGASDVDVLATLVGDVSQPSDHLIVFDIRLPRVILAVIVGAGVATAGAAIQGLFRNPLADPALIGVSGGAALFASAFLVVGGMGLGQLGLAGSAFIGGLLTTWLVLEIGRRSGTISSLLLAGVAINAVTLAGVGVFTYLSDDVQLRSVAFWALGSFNGADWTAVAIALVIPVVIALLFRHRQSLNAMTLGDREAGHLGINVERLRLHIIVLTALAVGVAVALCGVIAFVGLIVPHLVRLSLGSSHHVVIPGSMLLGGWLMLVADTLSRTLIAPAEFPVGIVTSLLGGPFFIYLIIRQHGRLGL